MHSSESPVRFSQELVDSLQSSPETDSTRERTQELHIQSRVAEELRRLQARESDMLRELEDQISAAELPAKEDGTGVGSGPSDPAAGDRLRALSRESIQREIVALKQKLEGRRKVEEMDPDMKKAKLDVVTCLRDNKQRPLDCWKEVEAFRREVARLEEGFVDKALR
ncbi:MAG: hypothetical protein M1838_001251 [Thelocarpon superellum]|nr:MAG: hypothetical protein M1838_001251 [Thelocarpon superellum]